MMDTVRDQGPLREKIEGYRRTGETVGFVPTMGYLHQGHLSLIRRARAENDRVVLSIYVNPTQFAPEEDLEQYPRDLTRDLDLARAEGVDLVFMPDDRLMYPKGFGTYVEVSGVTENLCGASRPGHFRGVATVVAKLFLLVTPDRAYFGRKDAQQAAVIGQMIRDLAFPVTMVVCPLVREPDGLAMSSRNANLTEAERAQALLLNRALREGVRLYREGQRSAEAILDALRPLFDQQPLLRLDYLKIVDPTTMQDSENVEAGALIAVAAYAGRTRLIDNMELEDESDDA